MKYQALFSSKEKNERNIKLSSAAIFLGSLRVEQNWLGKFKRTVDVQSEIFNLYNWC